MFDDLLRTPAAIAAHVHELERKHVPLLKQHFVRLDAADVRMRFGLPMAREQIDRYVDGIAFERDRVFGVFADDLTLAGVAHLACGPGTAELGLSVLPEYRGRGIGSALFDRGVMHARNLQIVELFMHCLAENAAILHIARKAGMRVVHDHSEADAYLVLPPGNPMTLSQEMVDRHLAFFDWACKACCNVPRHVLQDSIP